MALCALLGALWLPTYLAAPPAAGSSSEQPKASVGSLPAGGPWALHRPAARTKQPNHWPFASAVPQTSGFSRLKGGSLLWAGFPYDDHGAVGSTPSGPLIGLSPATGTFTYPPGPAADNGADIVAAGVGLTTTETVWRVDWSTLASATVPLAVWGFDTDNQPNTGTSAWPVGTGVSARGTDAWLVVSSRGAWLLKGGTLARTDVRSVGGGVVVDRMTRSFLVYVPRRALPVTERWTVRLVAGLATADGRDMQTVPTERGRLPSEPSVYDVAFRTDAQEPVAGATRRGNWWREDSQARALARGDIGAFGTSVDWDALAKKKTSPEPQPRGWTDRWYLSSSSFGSGVRPGSNGYASDFRPNFLGRVQPYGIYVPRSLGRSQPASLTILLHAINVAHNEFAIWNPSFLEGLCEARKSICVVPLGRGADGWWANEAEQDMWEVWNRVASSFTLDSRRTVLGGYSMGGYGAYRLGLEHPDLFSAVVVLAGAPDCAIRVTEGTQLSVAPGIRDCDSEADTSPLVVNGRRLPIYIGHDGADELSPLSATIEQAAKFREQGDLYRLEVYPTRDHAAWATNGSFAGALEWLRAAPRRVAPAPRTISYTWYAQHQRRDLGTGPGQAWWLSGLRASSHSVGFRAHVNATSWGLPEAKYGLAAEFGPVLNSDGPGFFQGQTWRDATFATQLHNSLSLEIQGVAALTVDMNRAGVRDQARAVLSVRSDGPAELSLIGLVPGTRVTGGVRPVVSSTSRRVTIVLRPGASRLVVGPSR